MKYSLRRLMIVLTLVCVLLGSVACRIEYLRQWAVFHEDKSHHADSGMEAIHHHRVAGDYRKTMLRPWITFNKLLVPQQWLLDETNRNPSP